MRDYSLKPGDKARLELVAGVIRHHGWCIGKRKDEAGRVCLLGAIGIVEEGDPSTLGLQPTETYRAVRASIDLWGPDMETFSVMTWNDQVATSQKNVLAMLQGGIDAEAAQ